MKIKVSLLAVCLAVVMLLPGQAFAARGNWFFTPYTSSISITFTDDFHSNLSGFPKVKEYFAGVERQNSASVLIDAGDFSMGMPYETVYAKDAPELHVMDQVGYDLIAMGTSEFSLGMDPVSTMLASREKEEKKEDPAPAFGWFAAPAEPEPPQLTCANVTLEKDMAKTILPYTVLEAGTRRVAVFSMVDPTALEGTDVKAEDPVSTAKKTAKEIMEKEKPDLLVCLYSGGKRDEDFATEKSIAEASSSISLIVSSGSSRKTDKPVKAGSARIVSAGGPERIGTVNFTLKDEKMVFEDFSLGLLDKSVLDDATVAETAAKYKGIYDKDYFKAYGYAYEKELAVLDSKIKPDPSTASNDPLGRLVADAYRYTASKHGAAEVAVVSAESLKELKKLPEGKVQTKYLYKKLRAGTGSDGAIGTGITRAYISGAKLRELVGAGIPEGLEGKQLIFSGIKCTYNPHRFGDDKLYDFWIMLQDGKKEELEPDRQYCIILDEPTAKTLQTSYDSIWSSMTDEEGNALEDNGAPVLRDKSREVKRWVALAAYLNKQGSEAINAGYGAAAAGASDGTDASEASDAEGSSSEGAGASDDEGSSSEGADASKLAMITYDYSRSPFHIFKERGKLLGVFIAIIAIILALIILLILFIRGRRRPGGYPRSSNAARLQYKRYRKQKQRPIFKRRRNRYK